MTLTLLLNTVQLTTVTQLANPRFQDKLKALYAKAPRTFDYPHNHLLNIARNAMFSRLFMAGDIVNVPCKGFEERIRAFATNLILT